MSSVLVTARIFGHLSDKSLDMFTRNGLDVVPNPYKGKGLSENELIGLIKGVDALLTGVDQVTAKVIRAADRLKVISKFGTGVDNIDLDAATENGIIVTNTPGMNANAVADMTFSLMLGIARKVTLAFDQVRAGRWSLIVGTEIWKKSLGLIGLGKIGKGVAIRASGFNMKLLAYDKFPDKKFAKERNIKLVTLNQLLQASDFISIHVPLTPDTENLIGKCQFEMMKTSAFLINTARGGIVDENALYDALVSGRIAGAAVDVLKEEPPKKNRLVELENFIITPHISSFTKEAIRNTERVSAQNIIDLLKGGHSPYIVNPEVLTRRRPLG